MTRYDDQRAEMLLALRVVDYVHIFDEADPVAFLQEVRPDVHVNGAEYGEGCIESETVRRGGGRLHLVSRVSGTVHISRGVGTWVQHRSPDGVTRCDVHTTIHILLACSLTAVCCRDDDLPASGPPRGSLDPAPSQMP